MTVVELNLRVDAIVLKVPGTTELEVMGVPVTYQ